MARVLNKLVCVLWIIQKDLHIIASNMGVQSKNRD
ncbi:hypothetical protein DmLsi_26720 [Lactiplantibacillus plantarum]|nr:hypothetical protein DmLsi_26720 [Lactiplantibacillus plantarum]